MSGKGDGFYKECLSNGKKWCESIGKKLVNEGKAVTDSFKIDKCGNIKIATRTGLKALGFLVMIGGTAGYVASKYVDCDGSYDSFPGNEVPDDEMISDWDKDPEYMRIVPGGEFSSEEYVRRTQTLPNGEVVFEDIGQMVFYKVREGDEFKSIKNNLSKYERFEYLNGISANKLKSFNIRKESLKDGMWIPLPLKEEDRSISDLQMFAYGEMAIDEMLKDEIYGAAVKKIVDKVGRKYVLAAFLATAKRESGVTRVGEYEIHRWEEGKHKAFSFSHFHVVMVGPGIQARRNLNMTEGQTYHPKNGAKLFLAFICEKIKSTKINGYESAEDYFPLNEHLRNFATFYNGSKWPTQNPDYVSRVSKHHQEALELLDYLDEKGLDIKEALEMDKAGTFSPDGGGEVPAGLEREDLADVVKACKTQYPGLRCEAVSGSYTQNERMLSAVNGVNAGLSEDQAERLKKYYCTKLGDFLDAQKNGKLPRPKGDWSKIEAKRNNHLKKNCKK